MNASQLTDVGKVGTLCGRCRRGLAVGLLAKHLSLKFRIGLQRLRFFLHHQLNE